MEPCKGCKWTGRNQGGELSFFSSASLRCNSHWYGLADSRKEQCYAWKCNGQWVCNFCLRPLEVTTTITAAPTPTASICSPSSNNPEPFSDMMEWDGYHWAAENVEISRKNSEDLATDSSGQSYDGQGSQYNNTSEGKT
jgi:hypothetical protein